jgi:hypothetical protein
MWTATGSLQPGGAKSDVVNWAYDSGTQTISVLGTKCDAPKSVGARLIQVVSGCASTMVRCTI